MASLFPTNPTPGQQHTIGSTTYTWTGYSWIKVSTTTTLQSVTVHDLIADGSMTISTSTISTSTTTGALVVTGGIGVGNNINVEGTVTINDITQSTGTGTGALIVNGGASIGRQLSAESIRIADAVFDTTLVITTASTSTVVIDSYDASLFRSAKYLIQMDEGTGPTDRCQVIEILLLISNAGTIFATEYAVLASDIELGTFAAALDIFDNTVKLYFTPVDATVKEIVVLRTGLRA